MTTGDDSDRWEQASDWLASFEADGAELPTEQMDAFHRWISDERNRHAFDRVEILLRDRQHCRDREIASRPERRADTYDPRMPLKHWRDGARSPLERRRRLWLPLVTAAAASFVVAALVVPGLWSSYGRNDAPRLYETKAGEQSRVHLPDGSTVSLGPQTSLSATFTPQRRSVILSHGEALFEVAHDTGRPFVVIAGSGSITAVGTAFDVRRDDDRVVVTVTEGTVSVAPQAESAAGATLPSPRSSTGAVPWVPARVTHGERLAYDESGAVTPVEHADTAAATAWREGHLQFYGEPLRSVVQAVNRYSKRQIMIDSAAGDLLYTGNVVPNRIDAWVQGLERIFPVTTVEADDEHVLIRMSGQAPTH